MLRVCGKGFVQLFFLILSCKGNAMIKVSSKIFKGDESLGFTRMIFTKTMLNITQNLELLKV